MKRFFKWLLLLVIGLATGIVVVLYNPHLVKGPLERFLSDLAGYSVTVDGELEIETGRLSEITANNIRVSGPQWASREELIAVGRLNLVVNTASIFKDIVLVESLQVDRLQLNLETNAEGTGNWITANTPSSPADKEGNGTIVIFNNVNASDATLRFRNGKTDVENVFNIASLSHHQQADGMLHTTMNGDLNNRLVEYTQTVGPYKNLLDGRDISISAAGHFGELVMKGDGLIDSLLEPRQPTFNLDMQGPNIDEITAMLGISDLGGGGFFLHASGAQVNGAYEADINGKVGDITLSAAAQASEISRLNELDLTLAINGPSLYSFTQVFGIEDWPDKPFNLKGDVQRIGGTLNISDLTLNIGGTQLLLDALLTNFPGFEASRVKLKISGDDIAQFRELLNISGISSGPFELNGTLSVSPEGLDLLKVDLDTSLGHATLSGTLASAPTYIGSVFNLHLDGNNANTVMSAFGMDILPEKPFNLNSNVEVVKNGLLVERGVLVTIEDERLELGGFIAFDSESRGTDVDLRLSGKHPTQVLQRHVGNVELPDSPYDLKGHVRVQEGGISLENVELEFEAIRLKTDGLIRLNDQLSGTALDFQISGENLSTLENFKAVGSSLDSFVPGQPYQATGRFLFEQNGWKLDGVKGRVGKTDLDFDALISKQADWSGTNIRLSVKGPDLNELLVKNDETGLPAGGFESSARIMLTGETLSINDFNFETANANGKIDLELGWPVSGSGDIKFNVNIRGQDIRNLLPRSDAFEAEKLAFQLTAVGDTQGELINIGQFDSEIGNLRVSLLGTVNDHPEDDSADITFNITSNDISKLGRLKGEQLPALPLDIGADFKGSARQFIFSNLVGSLGESRLNGELEISLSGSKPDIRLRVTSDFIDIRPFLGPENPDVKAVATGKPDHLIPATPLPLEELATVDLQIRLDIAELRYRQDSLTDLLMDLELQAGSLDIRQFSYDAPRGKLWTSLSIQPTSANRADVKFDLGAEKFVFNLSGLEEDKLDQVPKFDIDFHASGNGADLRELAGTMNGSLYMGSQGGNAGNVDLSLLETFILDQIFSVIMPKSRQGLDTQLSCIATIMEINDGLVTTKPALAFTSDRIAVVAKGTLDLKTEKMNFNFNATPTNALNISAGEIFQPYILIGGTLANPVVGVDPGKAALHGGAAIATLGVSVLAKGVVDRLSNAVPVCGEMLKKGAAETIKH
jgi:uncharacterized protein involved in outer membrane biogenesis